MGNCGPKLSPHADQGNNTELEMVMLTDGCSMFLNIVLVGTGQHAPMRCISNLLRARG